jgi:arsenate reductase-like glutaredoxin family protein
MADDTWLNKLVEEPMLLRMPLVRSGNQFTIGLHEDTWKQWK